MAVIEDLQDLVDGNNPLPIINANNDVLRDVVGNSADRELGNLTDAAAARDHLGSSVVGDAVFTAPTAGDARTALGLGTAATAASSDFAAASHSHSNASTGAAGFMSAADKTKLNTLGGTAVIADATDGPSAITQLNSLLAELRAQGILGT